MFNIEKTLAFAFSDESSFHLLRKAITNDLAISNAYYLKLARFYDEFYREYKSFPKEGDLKVWFSQQDKTDRLGLKSAYESIKSKDISDYTKEYVLNEAIDGLRDVATRNAIKRMDVLGHASPEVMADMLEQINEIKATTIENIVNIRDVGKWIDIKDEVDIKYKTGIHKLDSYIGGLASELVFVLAGTGIGKTTTMINLAKSVAFQGGNVLHITLELFDKITVHRYYRRIAEAHKNEFFSEQDKVRGLIEHWMKWAEGNVHIVYYPAFSKTVQDIKSIVRQYVDEYGHVDMIVLDYLDLLEADKGYGGMDGWAKLGKMSHEIRGLCSEYDTCVVSAAQANREGMDAHKLKFKHMAGSVQKLQAADLVFGLMQDEEEANVNQGRLCIMKARENPGRGQEIPLYIDMDRMLVLDLDHPDSQRIIREQMEELNHGMGQQVYAA